MARIEVEPSPFHGGLYAETYDRLIEDMKAAGHEAALRPAIEYRGGGAWQVHALYTVTLYVYEFLDDHVLDALVALVLGRILVPRRRGVRPRGVIYGSDGRPLREFDLPEEPES